MHKTRIVTLICLIALATNGAAGQKNIASPFARYGIGNLELQGTFRTLAMGGISSGIRNNITLNYLTPASYSSIDTTSFVFDFGLDYAVVRLKENEDTHYSQDLGFSHIMLGFPIMKRLGVTTGIVPFSNGFYSIADVSSPDLPGSQVAGDVYQLHKGTGGYQKFIMGAGYAPFRFLSVGINSYIIFGEISRLNDFIFTADNSHFHTRKTGTNSMHGISYEASAQIMVPLPQKWFINAGVTYTPSFNLTTSTSELVMRYSTIQTSLLSRDTLYQSQSNATSRLPSMLRGGIAFGREEKLTVGADLVWAGWSEALLPGNHGTYANTIFLQAGAEYIPDKYSNYNYFDRMEYRIGCRYGESYALFDGNQLSEYGITFGAGIPLRRSRSRISVYVDLSSRGISEGSPLRETRLSVGASLNLFDYWFLKAKYD